MERHGVGVLESGYSFGRGNLMIRIYDKLLEIDHSQKIWFRDLWKKHGWDGESSVTRVEFQMRREFLKSMQVDTMQDLEVKLADLWAYVTNWLTLRDPNPKDRNRSRWPLKPFWDLVSKADTVSLFGNMTGVMRITQRKPRFRSLEKFARGAQVSMVAVAASTFDFVDVEAAINGVARYIVRWTEESQFMDDVEVRMARMALMPDAVPDPVLAPGG